METKILKSYFHPTYPNEIVIVEVEKSGQVFKKQLLLNDVLDRMITIPIKQLPDEKVLRKANELALERV